MGKTSPTNRRGGRPRRTEAQLKAAESSHLSRVIAKRKAHAIKAKTTARKIPVTPDEDTIEKYCRTMIPGYDPWRDSAGYVFDVKHARAKIKFFHKRLTHIKGDLGNRAFWLEPWEMAIVGNLFGWLDSDGRRRYRKAFIFVAQKNGKTPFAAGLALVLLVEDGEPGAEIYSAAYTREQAHLVWNWAKGMVGNDAKLSKDVIVRQKTLVPEADRNALYGTIVAKEQSAHGVNASAVVIDEEHLFDRLKEDVIETLEDKTAARSQPLFIIITTAGWDRESICFRDYTYAKRVRDGEERDAGFLPVIYETPADADWEDESCWAAANPNLGISVKLADMRRACKGAKGNPRKINRFRQLRLNQWTEQAEVWIPMAAWERCGDDGVTREAMVAKPPRRCFGGLDVGLTTDHTAFALVFPMDAGLYSVLCWYWMPRGDISDKCHRDRVDYLDWAREDWITLTDGGVTDFLRLRVEIASLCELYGPTQVAFDPWRAGELTSNLQEHDGLPLVKHRQGYISMSPPSTEFERLVLDGKLRHGGNPILKWNFGNLAIDTDPAGNIKPTKRKSAGRIDGMIATIMAVGLATTNVEDTTSPYAEHGIRTLDL